MLSAIQLKRHLLAEINIKPVVGLTDEQLKHKKVACRQSIALQHMQGNTLEWFVRLRVELLPGDTERAVAYTGAVELIGEFKVHPDVPEADRENLIRVNGAAVLFGPAREWVAMVTARSLHGMIELPTIDPRAFLPAKPAPKTPAKKPKAD